MRRGFVLLVAALLVVHVTTTAIPTAVDDATTALLACTVRAPQYMSPADRESLCRRVNLDTAAAPADCATHLHLKVTTAANTELAVGLCQNATSLGPALCFLAVRQQLARRADVVLTLCRGAVDEEPALCFQELDRRLGWPHDQLASVCADPAAFADTRAVLGCLQRPPVQGLSRPSLLTLCRRPDRLTDATTTCFKTLGQQHPPSVRDTLLPLCLAGHVDGALACLTAAPRSWPPAFKVELCMDAQDAMPVECAKGLGSAWSPARQLVLCRGATSTQAVRCVAALSVRFSSDDKLALCGTSDDFPFRCTRALQRRDTLAPADQVALCRGATSLTPADCFNAAAVTSLSTPLQIQLCAHSGTRDRVHCVQRLGLSTNHHVFTPSDVVRLCAAPSPGLHACLDTGLRAVLPPRHVMDACHLAATDAPAHCLKEHLPGWTVADKAALCHRAT
ncbi:hypothetical protein As57867_016923, partial [Aphanomyces stellatus]